MKKIVIYILCLTLFFQNSVTIYASEISENQSQKEQTLLEMEKNVLDSDFKVEESENINNLENIESTNEIDNIDEPTTETENVEDAKDDVEELQNAPIETDTNFDTEEDDYIDELEEESDDVDKLDTIVDIVSDDENEDIIDESNDNSSVLEEIPVPEDEDPLFGRYYGFLDNGFVDGLQLLSDEDNSYIHNSKFDGYRIKEVIDVSKYQRDIDWNKVKQSGIDYAIIRGGFRGYGENGSLNTDEYFEKNMKGALSAGIEVGVYIFSQAISAKEAVEEAKYVLNLVKGYDVSLPIVMDFEYSSSSTGNFGRLYNAKLSKTAATDICKKFCQTIENQGYSAMIYANKSMLESQLNAAELEKSYKIWLANYTTSTSYAGDYEFWQYTSTASVEGIEGNVDKSFWYIEKNENNLLKDVEVSIADTFVTRIFGENRYETSFKIAETLKKETGVEKFDSVIVSSGTSFADALAGSYLANKKNAPILMTNGRNAEDVKIYIKNNLKQGGTVYLLGGTAALPEGVGCGLKDYNVKRLWGATRYETNIEILKETDISGQDILVCTGKGFADSLSCSAVGKPILLVADKLTEQQKQFLSCFSGNKIYVIGGVNAINTTIEKQLQQYGKTERIGGKDRYETSVMIAETFFAVPDAIVLAYSQDFPDGLCGGPLALRLNAPMILSMTGKETYAKAHAEKNKIHKGKVLGGGILISDAACKKILGELSKLESEISAEIQVAEEDRWKIMYHTYLRQRDSSDDNYYLMRVDSLTGAIIGEPLASISKNLEISITIPVSDRGAVKEILMDKVALAIKTSNENYQLVNASAKILNPEAIAKNKSEIFKASSKKGIQGAGYAANGREVTDARYSNTKQTLFNLNIASVVSTTPKKGYVEYVYEGNTYYFSDCVALQDSIRSLNRGYEQYLYGSNGTTKVSVSLCLLLGYNANNKYLIDVSARTPGHDYYMLNVREEKAKETLEALFIYLGEIFGQEDCYVTNWILGNEVNSSKAWNYSGNMKFESYMECYTTAFEILYYGVKSEKSGNTVSISLDNGWTAIPDTYAGKTTLDTFAKKIYEKNPKIDWSIAYHPYSYPLTRTDFWNDSTNTTNSNSTKYISMKNINVLTNYAASLEKKYGKDAGTIRVLLTEQGYSGKVNSSKEAYSQAEALARGYYIAEFNDRIDAFIIRALLDDEEEMKGKLYLGLMDYKQNKKTSFYIYEYMDSDLTKLKQLSAQGVVTAANYGDFNNAKKILCNTNWKSTVPGFNVAKLAKIK